MKTVYIADDGKNLKMSMNVVITNLVFHIHI